LTPEAFERIVRKYAKEMFTSDDIMNCFEGIPKRNEDFVTYDEFENAFKVNDPQVNVRTSIFPKVKKIEEEQRIERKILDWMLKRKYSSEDVFEKLLRSVSREQ